MNFWIGSVQTTSLYWFSHLYLYSQIFPSSWELFLTYQYIIDMEGVVYSKDMDWQKMKGVGGRSRRRWNDEDGDEDGEMGLLGWRTKDSGLIFWIWWLLEKSFFQMENDKYFDFFLFLNIYNYAFFKLVYFHFEALLINSMRTYIVNLNIQNALFRK